jgi:arginine:pyruvate transaminase
MAGSQTKQRIIERHRANRWLQTASLGGPQQDALDLSVDQPTSEPHRSLVDSAATALAQGQTHYVEVPGIKPLREKLAAYLAAMGVAGYEMANVLITAGMQESRFLSIQKIGETFGAIGVPDVVHPGVRQAIGVRPLEVKPIAVDRAAGMTPALASIRTVLEGGCRLLYLESPVRLTGAAIEPAAVAAIAGLAQEFDAAVIWDQGLAPWVYGALPYVSLGSQPGMAEHAMLLGEAWPGMGLESWFAGYIAARPDWWEMMRAQKQAMAICTSTPTQFAALQAAERYDDEHSAHLETLGQYHHEAAKRLDRLESEALPGSTVNLIAVAAPDPSSADRQRTRLQEAGFVIADGAAFGAPGVLRIAITPDNRIADALGHLA